MAKHLKRFVGKALNIDREKLTLSVIMSTNSVDRDGDIVRQKGGLDPEVFLTNPVVLWAHQRTSVPIAKVLKVRQTKTQTLGDLKFDKSDPYSVFIFNKYADGFLNAWSIGFQSKAEKDSVEMITDDEGRVTGYDFKSTELNELSAVPVPANAEALVRELDGLHAKGVERYAKGLGLEESNPMYLEIMGISKSADPDEETEPKAPDTIQYTITADSDGTKVLKDGEETKLFIADTAFKKTLEERANKGKVPTSITFDKEARIELDVEILQVKDNEIVELKMINIRVILSGVKESEAPKGQGREDDNTDDDTKALTEKAAAERDAFVRDMQIDLLKLNA